MLTQSSITMHHGREASIFEAQLQTETFLTKCFKSSTPIKNGDCTSCINGPSTPNTLANILQLADSLEQAQQQKELLR